MSNEINVVLSLHTMQALTKLEGFLTRATEGLKELAVETLAAYASFEGLHKLEDAVKDAINLEVAIGRLSEKTGLAIPTIEGLRVAAASVKVPFETLDTTLGRFTANIYEAAEHGGKLGEDFKAMGVKLLNANGTLRLTDDILRDTIGWLKAHTGSQRDAAFATDLFSKSGRELIAVFDQWAASASDAREAGSPITERSVQDALRFDKTIQDVRENEELFAASVANNLMPSLIALSEKVESITKDMRNSQDAVTGVADIFKGLISVVGVAGLAFYDLGMAIGYGAEVANEELKIALETINRILRDEINVVKELIKLQIDLATTSVYGAAAAAAAISGHLPTAYNIIRTKIAKVADDIKQVGASQADVLTAQLAAVGKFVSVAVPIWGDYAKQVMAQWHGMSDFLGKMWSNQSLPKGDDSRGTPHPDNVPTNPSNDAITQLREKDELLKEVYQQQLKLVESDPFRSQVEKAKELLPLLDEQAAKLEKQIDALHKLAAATTDDQKKLEIQKEIVRVASELAQVGRQQQTEGGLTSILSQMDQAMTELKNKWGSFATQIATAFKNTFNSAIESISHGITGLIMGTENWSRALMSIGQSILTQIVEAIVQMGVRWVTTHVMMETVGRALATASLASNTAIAAAQTALWSTPATLSTIATYGMAADQAPALIVAAEGIVAGASARESGGYVQAGQMYVVGEKRPELFVPRSDGYIHPEIYPSSAAAAASGLAAQSSDSGEVHVHTHSWPDEKSGREFIRAHPELENHIVDTVKKYSHQIISRQA